MATIINAATPNTSAGPATSTVALNTTGGSGTCFLGFAMSRSPNITPSDTFGNTWTPLTAEQTVTLNSINYFCRVWICVGGTGGNNHQFTATNDASGAVDFITVHFIELVGDVVGLDEVSDWVVDGTADYESDVLNPSAPNALIFAFNQLFSTTAGASFTHGDDGFADVASAYLNGFNGPVGEIRYQFGGAPSSYQTIITATNPSPRDVGAFLFSIKLGSSAAGVELEGSINSESAASAGLGLQAGLAAATISESAANAQLSSTLALAGATYSESSVNADLSNASALAGSIASVSAAAGVLVQQIALVSTAHSTSRLQGELTTAGSVALAGSIASESALDAALGLELAFSGAAQSESAAGGELTAGSLTFSGTISSISTADGRLNVALSLSGAIQSVSDLTGELLSGNNNELAGVITSVSDILPAALRLGPYIDMQESITLNAYGSIRIYSNGTRLFTV